MNVVKWKVETHNFLFTPRYSGCALCVYDYWDHKWNNNTIQIWRTALIVGLVCGIIIGILLTIFIQTLNRVI